MNLILLSGGSGKRLWPLSNDIRSKQFLKILRSPSGEYESMVQRVCRQIKTAIPDAEITITPGKRQVSSILNQIGDKVSICVEPARRDTFPAIALASAFLASEKGVDPAEPVVVCPVDPYTDDGYFKALGELAKAAGKGESNLYLLGVKPTYPSEKYGYIMPGAPQGGGCYSVNAFKEKPTAEKAKDYIKQGALWNCGAFAFRLDYLLDIVRRQISFETYWDVYRQYEKLEKISFDYAVVEKEPHISCMEYSGDWKDIGTWNTMVEEMAEPTVGNVIPNDTCENTAVINELSIPVLCMGMKDAIVAVSGDGILVSSKAESSNIKPLVDKLNQQVRYAEKSWGSFTVLDVQEHCMTIKIFLRPGQRLTYHRHEHRDEVWTVISGRGYTIVDGMEESIKPGDVIAMAAGCKHTVRAETELQLIEVQVGEEINAADKEKFDLAEELR
ncbi:MAG: cupin domain-containing protein [Clostridiales bacterium]|nr:cupin domain-containing protein [Clostridiales bacterium]